MQYPARHRLERLVRLYRRRNGDPIRAPLITWLGQPLDDLSEAECRFAARQFEVMLDNLAGSHRSQVFVVLQSAQACPPKPAPRRPHFIELWFEFWLRWWTWPLHA